MVLDDVFHHQVTLTTKVPRQWKTHNFYADLKTRKPTTTTTTGPQQHALAVGKRCLRPPRDADLLESRLPSEIHVAILSYCSAVDLARVARCSKYWNSVCEASTLWKGLCDRVLPTGHWPAPLSTASQDQDPRLQLRPADDDGALDRDGDRDDDDTVGDNAGGLTGGRVSWKQEYAARLAKWRIDKQRAADLHQQRMQMRYWMMCGVHMFHRVNGRVGFDALPAPELPAGFEKPPIETVKAMLKREDELRLSPAVQARFADPSFDAIVIAAQVQAQVATEFGFVSPELHRLGIDIMQAAPALYPEHRADICRIPHYRKYNRSRRGDLEPGDTVPDAYLAHLSGAPVRLFEYLNQLVPHQLQAEAQGGSQRPVLDYRPRTAVITCGSYT
eukprot:TRINITY_DN2825_c0_g1_i1.p1 TRINITY_DN2825_c0_g1~~TRINITY_DN2825_c0_g1_i1.p1  ORF type:complete len:388 (-),score=61.11 TRINITY_DN2825_c0_g1_i1:631-1794(-)